MSFFEDIEVGDRRALGTHLFTHDEIVAFAKRYDPQAFHVDDEAAKRTHFGGIVASGWHTASMWMKYFVADRMKDAADRRARGEPVAQVGPSPGFRTLRWLKPVYPGDRISFATEVKEKLTPKTKAGWGILVAHNSGVNQHGDLVIDFESTVFIQRRT